MATLAKASLGVLTNRRALLTVRLEMVSWQVCNCLPDPRRRQCWHLFRK